MTHPYDPNQPRVPAGRHQGGQWTRGGAGDTTIAKQVSFGHNDPVVQLAFRGPLRGIARPPFPLVQPPPTKPAESAPSRPVTPPSAAPILQPPSVLEPPSEQPTPDTYEYRFEFRPWFSDLLKWVSSLSLFDNEDRRTVLVFKVLKAREYRRSPALEFEAVRVLKREEVEKICGELFKKLQDWTDAAYEKVRTEQPHLGPRETGIEVHKLVADRVNGMGDDNFRAEMSFNKEGSSLYVEMEKPGAKDSIRPDARLKKPEERTVCIGDIKTGSKGLKERYIKEIANRLANTNDYKDFDRLIISEVRPTKMRPPKPKPTLQDR